MGLRIGRKWGANPLLSRNCDAECFSDKPDHPVSFKSPRVKESGLPATFIRCIPCEPCGHRFPNVEPFDDSVCIC